MVNVREKWQSAGKIDKFNKSYGSARIKRLEAEKASVQQYKGKCQKNITSGSKGRTFSDRVAINFLIDRGTTKLPTF